MPLANRTRIHDRVMGLRFMPGKRYSLAQIALALSDLWPGVEPNQVRGVIAGLASKEKAIREAMAARNAERTARLESG
jgi:hypothetical protein